MKRELLFAKLLFLCLFLSSLCSAQNTEVKGQVKDDAGNPVSGAVVTLKGSGRATATGEDGTFAINAPRGATLIISHIGFGTRELRVEGALLNVALTAQSKELDEVVVTALGIKKEKKALSYSVGEVKGSDLTEARSVNVANSLEGKVSGLNVVSTATGASGSSRITLRGNGSISGDNQPLIVVDGIPIDNTSTNFLTQSNNNAVSTVGMWAGTDQGQGISSINPDEIETVTVLKGGTAAALWGSRASNGAILITTKSGKKGAGFGVEVTSNAVAENIEYKKMKDYQYQYGAGDLGVAPTTSNPNTQTNSYGAKLDGHQVIQYDGVLRPYSAVTDNLSKFYKTGLSLTNGIAFTGSTEKTTYRFSATDLNYNGVMPGNTLNRDNYSININSNLSNRLSLLINAKYVTEKNHDRPILSDSPGNANYTLFTMPTSLSVATLKQNLQDANGFEIPFSGNVYVTNPYWATQKFTEDDNKNRIITSIEPKFNLTDWLYVKGTFGFDKYNFNSTSIIPTGTAFQVGGGYNRNILDYSQAQTGGLIGLDKNLGTKFSLSALVGANRTKTSIITDNSNDGTNNFNIPFFYNVSNINNGFITDTHGDQESTINSTYGSFDLGFNNYLFLNLTGREDWFSTLTTVTGTSKNKIFYPSVGLSYVISDAMQMPGFVNYMKVRASWAQVGGSGLSPYQLALTYNLTGTNGTAPLAQVNGNTIPNPKLTPYSSLSDEVGIETHLFKNRLSIDLAYYNHNISNDIVQAQVSPASGYQNIYLNLGKSTNKGVEATIGYRLVDHKDFSWQPVLNLAYNKSNMVTVDPAAGLTQITLDNPRSQAVNIVDEVGKPTSEIQAVAFLRNPAGQIVFNAQGLPMTAAKNIDMGPGISPLTMGITNSFRYKRFSLDILVDGKFGGYLYSGTDALAFRYGLAKETLPGRETGVVGTGVGTDLHSPNTVNVPAETYYSNLYGFGEPFVYSSNFIKLRSLTLDYSLPVNTFGTRQPFKSITISLVARNLWVIMKKVPNIDPESTYNAGNAQGLEFAGMPITRTMGLNLNLKF